MRGAQLATDRGNSRWQPQLASRLQRFGSCLLAIAQFGRPDALVHFGSPAPGDDLLCTAVLYEMRRRGYEKIWMCTSYPEIFVNNPDVDRAIPDSYRFVSLFPYLGGKRLSVAYPSRIEKDDRTPSPPKHLITLMCRNARLSGFVALRPYFHLTKAERHRGYVARNQVAIMSAGLTKLSPMQNKEWFPERFQEVVRTLRDRFDFVQLGSAADPLLQGAIDMRGKTTVREAAAVLANSIMFVGQVGFLMHLARAVECRAVIVYGGREAPWQSGYVCNENIYTGLSCAPCWYWNRCDFDRACMRRITPESVIEAVLRQAARRGTELPVTYEEIPADLIP